MGLDTKIAELNSQLQEHRARKEQLEETNKTLNEEKTQVEKEMLRLHRKLTELSKDIRENDKKIADYNTILDDSEKAYDQLLAHADSIAYALQKSTEELNGMESAKTDA